MPQSNSEIKPGVTLIAQPFMMDANFKRSVIGLCEHTEKDGTVGFILNKPMNMEITELMGDVETDEKFNVYYGGPVATDTLHYIHNVGDLLEESIKVADGIYWGGSFNKLKFLIDSHIIRPNNIKFYVGYSGWEAGQLNNELRTGSWIVSELYPNYIFKSKSKALWQLALGHKGDAYSVIAQIPNYLSNN